MKRFLSPLILLLLVLPAMAQRPKVGVVLCGGGAKGAAHVGVLKVLEENNIPIDYIAGTSMGAIIAGLYAIGYSASELDSLIMAQDWNFVMSDQIPRSARYFERKKDQDKYLLRIPFGAGDYSRLSAGTQGKPDDGSILSNIPLAVVNGQNIYNLFTRLSVGYQDSLDFNRMPIPFACVAVDLISKKEVVFHSGHFVDAIRSSMAIPGYFSPVRLGDMVLVDGGALNNYPVDVAREMGADVIIGVLLNQVDQKEPSVDNIGDLANELMDLYMDTKFPEAISHTDILVTPSTKGFNTLSFQTSSLRTLIDNGEAAAREKEDEIRKMKDWLDRSQHQFIGPIRQQPRYRKAIRLDRDTITLGSVNYTGLTPQDAKMLLSRSALKPGARISGQELEGEIARFYNTAAFESVTYLLKGTEAPYDLELNFVPGRKSVLGLGARFDNEEVAAILVNVSLNENALYGSKLSATAKLAYNMQAGLQYTYAFKSLAQIGTGYNYRSSNLSMTNTDMKSSVSFREHSFNFVFSTTKTRSLAVDLGARLDLFNYQNVIGNVSESFKYDLDLKRKRFFSPFVRFQLDRRDNEYFPNRGYDFDGEFRYFFQKPFSDHSDFMAARAHFTSVFPAGNKLAFLLTLDNRILMGNDIPMIYANIMGGIQEARYTDQQLPFIGFGYTHVFENVLSIATLDSRYRILDNHYVFASGAFAFSIHDLKTISEGRGIVGARLGYSYNSFFGPLSAGLFWSSYTRRVGGYISLGYSF